VLYFYPKDMTPGCTTEACDFRDAHENFGELDAVIIGISPDPVERHQTFIKKHNLPFMLLADEDHQVAETYGVWKWKKNFSKKHNLPVMRLADEQHLVAESYGVWKVKNNFGKEHHGTERSTFSIDKEGILQKAFRNVRVKGHVAETLALVK